MRTENPPFKFDLRKRFPDMRRLEAFEGGAEFVAEKVGKFYLIRDERTMADMILPDDEDLLNRMLTVLEFESEAERNKYIRRREREKNKEMLREGKVVSAKPLVVPPRKRRSANQKRRESPKAREK